MAATATSCLSHTLASRLPLKEKRSGFSHLKSYMRTRPLTDEPSLSGESQGWMLLRTQQEFSELHLLFLIENMLKEKKIKPKTSPSHSIVHPRE